MLAALVASSGPSTPSAAGLVLDVGGALFLAWGLMFKDPGRAIDELTPKYGFNSALEINAASQTADAQVGAALLVLGFVGQFVGSLNWWSSTGSIVRWTAIGVAVAVDVAAAWFLVKRWRPHQIRRLCASRLAHSASDLGAWWPILASYGGALGLTSDGGTTETVAAFGPRVIGRRRWERVTRDVQLPATYTKLRRDVPGTAEYEAAHGPAEPAAETVALEPDA